ncbi:hypothetical protein RI845_15050 [Thalassotalea nanhaiensis]|uniref:DUF4375 domain-containing protein n=1 Tax=Thalassotalea nanhaiensis TaxID=3065648 RepID=A0ABY9TGB9_9GAMM|nr:hypothetical protein RI845_15050 [Colwelliaceae bacterium SQ345]
MSTFDLIFFGALLIALIFTSKIAKKRKSKFQKSTNNFLSAYEFEKVTSIPSEIYRHGFSIFDLGGDELIENILQKVNRSCKTYIFDYKYSPNNQATQLTTQRAIFIKLSNDLLYNFNLKPEGVIDKIKQAIGYEDIDFDDFKEFSRKYALHSSERLKVEEQFPHELINILEKTDGMFIEARKNCLLIYNKSEHEYSEYEPLYLEANKYKELILAST